MKTKMIKAVRSCLAFLMGMTMGLGIMEYHAQNEREMLVKHIEILEANAVANKTVEIKPMVLEKKNEPMVLDSNFDIRTPYECSASELLSAIPEEHKISMYPLVKPIIDASNKYGLNPLYLASVSILESGWGTCESGSFNVMGWTAGDGSWRNFSNYSECFDHVARNLSTSYVDIVGPKLSDVSFRYCPGNPGYSSAILKIMGLLENNIVKEI